MSFRAMVGAGVLMFVLGIAGWFLSGKFAAGKAKWLLRVFMLAIFLPYLANSTGWMLTEVGRQPWIVQGLMTIDQAVSPNVTPEMLLISLIGFTLLYGALMVADIYLLQKFARQDMDGNTPIPWNGSPDVPATPKSTSQYKGAY
ncbi:MAG: cytochrome ubiquinol oxidase subunit I [Anaerolineae bacterium]